MNLAASDEFCQAPSFLWKGEENVQFATLAAQGLTRRSKIRSSLQPTGAVLTAAFLLTWPALLNGFPLLYPDSMTYLSDGGPVARAIFLHQFAPYYGIRSLIYSLGILPFHLNLSPWPVVGLQSLLVAWVLWLVTRSVLARHSARLYVLLILALSLLSSVSWYAGFIMPDILGPVLYLCIYLLVFAPETLSRAERLSLFPIAWWSATAHATHLLLAAGLLLVLAAFAAVEALANGRKAFLRRSVCIARVGVILAATVSSQMLLYLYLDGSATLNGERPPYLTARIIADGPGKLYLEQHCAQLHWAICDHLQSLRDDPDNFLWGGDGVFENISENEKARLRSEEGAFVLATLRAYPRQQIARSTANFRDQLLAFGLFGFDANPWIASEFSVHLQSARKEYGESRQAANRLPLDRFSLIQQRVVQGSLIVIAVTFPLLWIRRSIRLIGFGLIVTAMIVANAFLAGVLSIVDDRYGCRVIWMVPLLAAFMSLEAWEAARSFRLSRTNLPELDLAGRGHLS